MDDVIDFALMRHGELAAAIEKREAEIAKLQEEKESLELFVCTHKELSERAAAEKKSGAQAPEKADRESRPAAAVSPLMPVRKANSA